MSNVIHWFEIPTTDFDRAVAFYQSVFATKLKLEDFGRKPTAIFAAGVGDADVTGSIVYDPGVKPTQDGSIVYFSVEGSAMDRVLERVASHGGTVLLPRTSIGPAGFIAVLLDTEGNRVGLHAEP